MNLLTPVDWNDYELIDTGGREKLERFGNYILIRPEPQAVWKKALSEADWDTLHHARFNREEQGEWILKSTMPDQWIVGYEYGEMYLKFRLGLTSFGHVGLFPEQAENWKFVYDHVRAMSHEANTSPPLPPRMGRVGEGPDKRESDLAETPQPTLRVLNLFAYTGGASLAAKAAGADVVHVDSVKQVISWAREDMELSRLDGIRWVVEDALKFVRREVKRGNRYDGIILDPPAYGRGPEGEKWILEDSIDEIISLCAELLSPQSPVLSHQSPVTSHQSPFFILSLYSMGFSPLIGQNLIKSHLGTGREIQSGELYFTDRAGRRLPLGTFTRVS